MMEPEVKDKVQRVLDLLAQIPVEELGLVEGRYCGPSNRFLCENKFNCQPSFLKKVLDQYIINRSFEEIILNTK